MNRRLRRAIIEASELRAFYVLLVLFVLRAWRFVESIYWSLPSIHQIIHHIQIRFNAKLSFYLYPGVHWIGKK